MENSIKDVYKLTVALLQPLGLSETYRVIENNINEIMDCDSTVIFLVEENRLNRVHSSRKKKSGVQPRKTGYIFRTYKEGEPRVIMRKDLVRVHPEFLKTEVKSTIMSPLINRGKSMGVMLSTSSTKKFSEEDLPKYRTMGIISAMAIRKAQLYKELYDAISTRDLFISLASHELKTPITTISAYIQLLKRRIKKNEKIEENWLDNLLNELERLTALIDELLVLERVSSGKLDYIFEPSSIKEIIKHSIRTFKAKYPDRKVKFIDELEEKNDVIIADFNKMIQVIINLLDNAAKYSDKDIDLRLYLNKYGKITIEVEDKGQGIPPKDKPKVFKSFYKGANHTKEGMGLGLYLSQRIVNKHKGKIKIDSKINRGTKVEILLPLFKYE